MPRHRLPKQKAEVSGSALKDPQRHRARIAPTSGRLGEPYARMTETQKEAWAEFQKEMPWLKESHRALVEVACVLRARLIDNPSGDIGINVLNLLRLILGQMGGTPVDETKVTVPDTEDEDPAQKFFN